MAKKKKDERKVYHENREWLNPLGEGNAYIATHVSRDTWEGEAGKEHSSLEISFELTDCTRKVCLDFYGSTELGMEPALRKADILIREITAFRKALRAVAADEKKKKK